MHTPQNSWIEALQNWALENPIKEIERIRADYKNYDGHVGLPTEPDELLTVKNKRCAKSKRDFVYRYGEFYNAPKNPNNFSTIHL